MNIDDPSFDARLRLEHRRRRARALLAIAAGTLAVTAVILYVLFYIPLPYVIFGPGAAVDLSGVIRVPGHAPPPGSLFLTDVNVLPGRPAYYAAAKLLPGFEIRPRAELVPANVSDAQLGSELQDDMKVSQETAEVVAERAAGLHVPSHAAVVVVRILPKTPAARCFRINDKIVSVDGRAVTTIGAVTLATQTKPTGSAFAFGVVRGPTRFSESCHTAALSGKPRFGMIVAFDPGAYTVPIPVKFEIHDINGSSAGLMFALQIYRTLTGRDVGGARLIAGTGVIEIDGTVDPIEGAREKVEAAKRAGATVFLIPMQNYADVRGTPGIQIIPVASFGQALRALETLH
ncbi:MAG TPA: S16 family serine protease [Candidatus Eremiobacteraceae bacterium]|nr:S16 family serine protease [Candidatus Eremiobacteraceae bacterium]